MSPDTRVPHRSERDLRSYRGRQIAFEFTVFGEDGAELGGNVGGKPRVFEVGAGEMLAALENQLVEMAIGESRSVVLSPEDAYGTVREDAFQEFSREEIPEAARQVGRKVMGRSRDGVEEMFDVVETRGDRVVIDMNHPMAGKTLRFEIKVLHGDSGGD